MLIDQEILDGVKRLVRRLAAKTRNFCVAHRRWESAKLQHFYLGFEYTLKEEDLNECIIIKYF